MENYSDFMKIVPILVVYIVMPAICFGVEAVDDWLSKKD